MLRYALTSLLLTTTLGLSARAGDLNEELLAAARRGDAGAAKALLTWGADVNARNTYGATALSFAADKGHLAVVRLLLNHMADVNVKDTFYKATPLDWAVMHGQADVVGVLVGAGAKGADTALQIAAAQGRVEIVRAILATRMLKEEALSKALAATPARHAAVAELLKKAGAKPAKVAKVAVAPELLASYAGTYRGDGGDVELTVAAADGKLTLSFGGAAMDLAARDKATFQFSGSTTTITFRREKDKVSGLALKAGTTETLYRRVDKPKEKAAAAKVEDRAEVVKSPRNWPSFRGPNACGVADGQFPPLTWDGAKGVNVRWKTPIPGLGHSCPVVWGDRVYLTTAVSGGGKSALRTGLYGDVDSVKETAEHTWRVYCLDRNSGTVLWEQVACKGVPKVKRHPKGSHANPTPATDGRHVVASFGSEGLYCYDPEGRLLWKKDLGTLDSGWFYDADYQWGFGSSPVLYDGLVLVQCDVGKGSFVAAYRVEDGQELWRTARDEIPSWGTPTVVGGPGRAELVTNATRFARGYDVRTGAELWRLGRHSEITVPTPVFGEGLIFLTSGYRPVQPIYAVRLGAAGDVTLKDGKKSNAAVAWNTDRGGPYMATPLVYRGHLYVCSNAGIVTCYEAKTGKQVYKERLGGRGGYTASPVGADGKVYFTGEEGGVRVVRAGPKFELLAVNPLGEACLTTPAISDGMIFIRTEHHLFGIGHKSGGSVVQRPS